ncbi:SDR family NAD(P)-dependent oxidoreductase [Streptomyces subrutilus]|uniref:SDR family NAD(P)-dependent oxidoreductase n=1 Tax=Streptomyces subrutilus TaxID=36818 RepID=UPI0033FC9576
MTAPSATLPAAAPDHVPNLPALFSLAGKTAVVTGASRGIGAVLAEGFAQAGAEVVLMARSKADLEAVRARIEDRGGRAGTMVCDLADGDRTRAACQEILGAVDRVDILVNNAGGPVFQARFLDVREDGWNKIFDLNLSSVMRVTQEFGRHMVERGGGSIVNISSIGALQEWPEIAPYCAAKAAVNSLTRALAADWASRSVRVNAVCPGWIDTAVNRAYTSDPQRRSSIASAAVPLGNWAPPGDVLGTALWLASDASRFATGTVIPLDGGSSVGLPAALRAQLDPTA